MLRFAILTILSAVALAEPSTCPSGKKEGSLGSFGKGSMVKEFDAVVFDSETELDKVYGPVKTQFGYDLNEKDAAAMEFLREKVLVDYYPPVRDAEIRWILDPSSAPNDKLRKKYESSKERLDRILEAKGDVVSDVIPAEVQHFDAFTNQIPEWRDATAVVPKEHMVQRVQKSGLCYIHGPDVLQHYLVLRSGTASGMINIVLYIKQHFTAEQLYGHIFGNHGGSSATILEHILLPKSILLPFGNYNNPSYIAELFNTYGPALVSLFVVHNSFTDSKQLSHTTLPNDDDDVLGRHAMVMIGYRKTDGGEYRFLIQNWWTEKQFLEVSPEYLEACRATLHFVKTPQTEIPKKWPVTNAKYAELELIDLAEQYDHSEMM